MKRTAAFIWIALAFWHPGPAYADEAADPAAPNIGQLYAEVAATDPRVTVLGAYEHPIHVSPFSSIWLESHHGCALLVDADVLEEILNVRRDIPAEIRERTMIVHEFAHCLSSAGVPDVPAAARTHDSELFADLFALAWTARYHPADEDQAYEFLHTLRHDLQGVDKLHPRASELRKFTYTPPEEDFRKSLDSPQGQAYRAMHP